MNARNTEQDRKIYAQCSKENKQEIEYLVKVINALMDEDKPDIKKIRNHFKLLSNLDSTDKLLRQIQIINQKES